MTMPPGNITKPATQATRSLDTSLHEGDTDDLHVQRIWHALERARHHLLDTGMRNQLVHTNRTRPRARSIPVTSQDAAAVEDTYRWLRVEGKRMRFVATGKDRPGSGDEPSLDGSPDKPVNITLDNKPENIPQPRQGALPNPLGPEAMARRLLRMAQQARNAEEEQGINVLYLAMGFLRWRESPSSEVIREAPLVLLPVELVRHPRLGRYELQWREEDLSTNLPLQARLQQDFGLPLPEIEEDDDWRPFTYFDQVREAIAGQPSWEVDDSGILLGFFSFARLLMHRDLDPELWPPGAFTKHPILRGLLAEGFPQDDPLLGPDDKLDEHLDPSDLIHVVDADASQARVIEEVRHGKSLVVQGPPGTGKSQTITNLIAAAAHEGKTVLFVAEKMAALSVVYQRLVSAGLQDLCIELHSRSANKRAFVEELGRTLHSVGEVTPDEVNLSPLRETRDQLNGIVTLLHEPVPELRATPYEVIADLCAFVGQDSLPPRIPLAGLATIDRVTADVALDAFVMEFERVGAPDRHPFRGARRLDLQPPDVIRFQGELSGALQTLDELQANLSACAQELHRPIPRTLAEVETLATILKRMDDAPSLAAQLGASVYAHPTPVRLRSAIALGATWAEARLRAEERFRPQVWHADIEALHQPFVKGLRWSEAVSVALADVGPELRRAREALECCIDEAKSTSKHFSQPLPEKLGEMRDLSAFLQHLALLPPNAEQSLAVIAGVADASRIAAALSQGAAWMSAHHATAPHFGSVAWERDLVALRSPLLAGQSRDIRARFAPPDRSLETTSAIHASLADTANVLDSAQSALQDLVQQAERMAAACGTPVPSTLAEIDSWIAELRNRPGVPIEAASYVAVLAGISESDRLRQALEDAVDWLDARDACVDAFTEMAWQADATSLRVSLAQGAASWFTRWFGDYRRSSAELATWLTGPLPKGPADRLARLDQLLAVQAKRRNLAQGEPWLKEQLGSLWQGERTPFRALLLGAHWLAKGQQGAGISSMSGLLEALPVWVDPAKAAKGLDSARASWELAWAAVVRCFGSHTTSSTVKASIQHAPLRVLRQELGDELAYQRASLALSDCLAVALPDTASARLELVDTFLDLRAKRERWRAEEAWLSEELGGLWQGEHTDFTALQAVNQWWVVACSMQPLSSATQLLALASSIYGREVDPSASADRLVRVVDECSDAWAALTQRLPPLGVSLEAEDPATPQAAPLGALLEMVRELNNYLEASTHLAGFTSAPLPSEPAKRLALVEELRRIQGYRKELTTEELFLASTLGSAWHGEETDFSMVRRATEWLLALSDEGIFPNATATAAAFSAFPNPGQSAKELSAQVETSLSQLAAVYERVDWDLGSLGLVEPIGENAIEGLRDTVRRAAEETGGYAAWSSLQLAIGRARACGTGPVVDAVLSGTLPADRARQELAYACAEARWAVARAARPELTLLPQEDRHALARRFVELERQSRLTARMRVRASHAAQVPHGTMGQMGLIRGEMSRKRGHKPIRWLMKNAAPMVQRIKPIMLMSPLSVAQFMPPGRIHFDLVIMDEASQVRPEDALGVVARADQIVVVGDPKQLPPTAFFDRLLADSDEDDEAEDETAALASAAQIADMESILSLCEARGLRRHMLTWHYRSRDSSLIRVSNSEFYDDGLVLPPSPLQLDPSYGLSLHQVSGVYTRGGAGSGRRGTNRIEAEALVEAIISHIRERPTMSVGVVAFSRPQADMLTEVIELRRRRDPVLDGFLREGRSEDFFVKNIENVQGDERDVIFISIGYGPQEPGGRLTSMNFGPINGEGGARRLNVLFSRARVRCEVFASFDPSDIDLSRVTRDGPRVFKRFLEFAKERHHEPLKSAGSGVLGPLEADVAEAIRSLGYLADVGLGSTGFQIDIGVRSLERQDQYLLAVECDGAHYHAAPWARERDYLRQDLLERLGWRFFRVWSTQWFHERHHQVARLQTALKEAAAASGSGIEIQGANHLGWVKCLRAEGKQHSDVAAAGENAGEEPGVQAAPYVRASLQVSADIEPHEAPLAQLTQIISEIVQVEGPIHIDELARRLASAFGRTRTGHRITEVTRKALGELLLYDPSFRKEGPFVFTNTQAVSPPVRDRSRESGSLLKAAYLSPLETTAAAKVVLEENGAMGNDEMVRAVARLLGFRRVGNELTGVLREIVARVIDAT